MSQIGFFIDMSACIGCRVCQISCNDRNQLEAGTTFREVVSYEVGEYPDAVLFHYSHACNHCANPACAEACPTGATWKAEDGSVLHDDNVCIGCESCVNACPYGAPVLIEAKGIAGKCDSCKALRDAGQNPACVDACVMRCIDFGELEDLKAKHGEGLTSDQAFLPASSQTSPSTLIKPKASVDGREARRIIR